MAHDLPVLIAHIPMQAVYPFHVYLSFHSPLLHDHSATKFLHLYPFKHFFLTFVFGSCYHRVFLHLFPSTLEYLKYADFSPNRLLLAQPHVTPEYFASQDFHGV